MRALVTGPCGFIGSHIADQLLARGDSVVGVDSFTDYYDRAVKAENAEQAMAHDHFGLIEGSIIDRVTSEMLEDVDVVFHSAGQPGVRGSWGHQFDGYIENNIRSTQVLLERIALTESPTKMVYSSSSSVYGKATSFPLTEQSLTQPHSPYGVTKLAAEHLCSLYAATRGVNTVSLRYFTVYGPRQRPDMAFNRLFRCALNNWEFPLLGSGKQIRDFTYVDDIVAANLAVADNQMAAGSVFNVAGGSSASLAEAMAIVEELTGVTLKLNQMPAARGDVERTGGSTELLAKATGWEPNVALAQGLSHQFEHLLTSTGMSAVDLSV